LDIDSTEEREKYFWKSIQELGLDVNKSDFELIDNYAIYVAESVINNKILPKDGLFIMQNIVRLTDYSEKYIQFYEIDEDLDYLKSYNSTLLNTGLSLENADSFIIKEFELFLESEKYNTDDKIRDSAYCQKCGMIEKPKLKIKRNFIGKAKYQYFVCGLCKSEDILTYKSQKGKETILRKLKNAT